MRFNRWVPVLALVVTGAAAPACSDAPQQGAETAQRATSQPTSTAVDTGVVFVDVRTEREYEAGHVEGAIHIPHDRMAERYEELERFDDKQIVVYCRSGRRSGIAERILEEHGFNNVINGGGLRELASQGVPTTANCC